MYENGLRRGIVSTESLIDEPLKGLRCRFDGYSNFMSDVQFWEVENSGCDRVGRRHQIQSDELGVAVAAKSLARTFDPELGRHRAVVPHDAFLAGRHDQSFITAPLDGQRNLRIGFAASNIAAADIVCISVGRFAATFAGLAFFVSESIFRIAGCR
jgi:hypothetical protein